MVYNFMLILHLLAIGVNAFQPIQFENKTHGGGRLRMKRNAQKKTGLTLLFFYSPFCSNSIKLNRTWWKLKPMFPENQFGNCIRLAEVDCKTEKKRAQMCEEEKVCEWPTLDVYQQGRDVDPSDEVDPLPNSVARCGRFNTSGVQHDWHTPEMLQILQRYVKKTLKDSGIVDSGGKMQTCQKDKSGKI